MVKKLIYFSLIITFFVFPAKIFAQSSTIPTISNSIEKQITRENKIPNGSFVEKPHNLHISGSECSNARTADITFNWSHPTSSQFKIGWRIENQTKINNWAIAPNPVKVGSEDWAITYPGFKPDARIVEWGIVAIEGDRESTPQTNSTIHQADSCVINPQLQTNTLTFEKTEVGQLVEPSDLTVSNSKCLANINLSDMTFNWYHPTATEFEIGWRTADQPEITNYFPVNATEIVDSSINDRTHVWTFTYPANNSGNDGFAPGTTLAEWAVIAVENGTSSHPAKSGKTATSATCINATTTPAIGAQRTTSPSNLSVDTNLRCDGFNSSRVKFRWKHSIFTRGVTFKIAWNKDAEGKWEYIPVTGAKEEKIFGSIPTGYWNFTYAGFYTDGVAISDWVVVAIRNGKESFDTHGPEFTPKDCTKYNPQTETLTLNPNLQTPDSVDVTETKCLSYNNSSVTFAWHQKPGTSTNFQIGWSLTASELEYFTPPGIVSDGNGNFHVTIEGFNTHGEKITYWGIRTLKGSHYSQTRLGSGFIPEDCPDNDPTNSTYECCKGPLYEINENTINTIEGIRNFSATSLDEIQAELIVSPKKPLSWLNFFNLLSPGILIRNAARQDKSNMEIGTYAVVNTLAQQGYSVAKIKEFYSSFANLNGSISMLGLRYFDDKFLEGKFEKFLDCYFKQDKELYECDPPPALNLDYFDKDTPHGTYHFFSLEDISANSYFYPFNNYITDLDLANVIYIEERLIEALSRGSISKIIDNLALYDAASRQYLDTNDSLGNLYISVGDRLKGRADNTAKEVYSFVANNFNGQVAKTAKQRFDSLGGAKHFFSVFAEDFVVGFISADSLITGPTSKVFKATVVASIAGKMGKDKSVLKILSQKLFRVGINDLNESERIDFLTLISKYKAGGVLSGVERIRLQALYKKIARITIDTFAKAKNFDEFYSAILKRGPIDVGGKIITPEQLISRINYARKIYLGDPWNGVVGSTYDLNNLGTGYGIAETTIRLINKEFDAVTQLSQDAYVANTFDELFRAIKKAGTIHGSDGVTAYTPDKLIEIIRKASSKNEFSAVTRVGNLRYHVERITAQIRKVDTNFYDYANNAKSDIGFENVFRRGSDKVERTFHNGTVNHVVVNETDDVLQNFARQAANVDDPIRRIELLSKATNKLGYATPANGDPNLYFKLYQNKTLPIGHHILNGSVCFEKAIIVKASIDYLSLIEGRNDIKTRMVGGDSGKTPNSKPSCNHAWLEVALKSSNILYHIDPTGNDLLKVEQADNVYKRMGRIPIKIAQ